MKTSIKVKAGRTVLSVSINDVKSERKQNRPHFEARVRQKERARANVAASSDGRLII